MAYCMEYSSYCILCKEKYYSSHEFNYPFICYCCSKGRNKKIIEKIKEQYLRNCKDEIL